MFTYKFFLRQNKNNSLRLRITCNRKNVEISLGLRMTQETLDDALSQKPRAENMKWRSVLLRYQAKLDEIKCDLLRTGKANIEVSQIKEMVMVELFNRDNDMPLNDVKGSFLPHFRKFADMHQNKRTREIYNATISRIAAYDSNIAELNFEDITVEWLTNFDIFLAKTAPKKNARNIHFRNIRAVMKDAFKADLTAAHPFDRFRHSTEPTRKRSLTVETIRRIFNAEVEPWQQKYLDFFKLTFMLIGINVVDLCNATEIYDGRLEYNRAKTHKLYSIKVEPEALEIIERYCGETKLLNVVEGYANYRHFYNNLCKGLNSIREKLGLKELTTYFARHSWATIARKIGVSVDDIALALGHHDKKHETSFIYIDENEVREAVDAANRRVLDYVLYNKR